MLIQWNWVYYTFFTRGIHFSYPFFKIFTGSTCLWRHIPRGPGIIEWPQYVNYVGTKCNKRWKLGILNEFCMANSIVTTISENFQHEHPNNDVTTSPSKGTVPPNASFLITLEQRNMKTWNLVFLIFFAC